MPLSDLLLRQIDVQHQWVETVAMHGRHRDGNKKTPKTPLTASGLKRLLGWSKKGHVLHGNSKLRTGDLALLVPNEIDSDALSGPLSGQDGHAAALILIAETGKSFS